MVAAFADESQATFHGLVRYLAEAVTKADVASRRGRGRRVRASHHGPQGQGLEFAIVVLANAMGGSGGGRGGEGVKTLIDSSTATWIARYARSRQRRRWFMSAGFAAAEMRESAAASDERRRLAYVACTRAADHLVIPW